MDKRVKTFIDLMLEIDKTEGEINDEFIRCAKEIETWGSMHFDYATLNVSSNYKTNEPELTMMYGWGGAYDDYDERIYIPAELLFNDKALAEYIKKRDERNRKAEAQRKRRAKEKVVRDAEKVEKAELLKYEELKKKYG